MAKLKLDPQNSTNAIYQKSSDPRDCLDSTIDDNQWVAAVHVVHTI